MKPTLVKAEPIRCMPQDGMSLSHVVIVVVVAVVPSHPSIPHCFFYYRLIMHTSTLNLRRHVLTQSHLSVY